MIIIIIIILSSVISNQPPTSTSLSRMSASSAARMCSARARTAHGASGERSSTWKSVFFSAPGPIVEQRPT
jgi:hypothetical protein